jgi:hypothetical protein
MLSKKLRTHATRLLLIGVSFVPSYAADAQVKCYQAVNKVVKGKVATRLKVATRPSRCKTGEVLAQAGAQGPTGPQGATGLTGSTGAPGADGADGSLRVYGDGSAGERVVSSTTTLTDSNLMYTEFTVNPGVTLTVLSGTVIRCTGQFKNQGTIAVLPGTVGGSYNFFVGDSPPFGSAPAHPGISSRAAGLGAYGDSSSGQAGGSQGLATSQVAARALRYPGPSGGGAGAGTSSPGGSGGGALTVLCQNGILNEGTIEADGRVATGGGGGGGGGGVIILASATSVTSSSGSFISANGAGGSAATTSSGGGGSGGGGIIQLMAPTVTTDGATISRDGGPAVDSSFSVTSSPRFAGGGGGASGGHGSEGATLQPGGGFSQNTQSGASGLFLTSILDPTSLF